MKKIIAVIGARPQFIKHAPVELELQKKFIVKSIHTGQHYDEKMSNIFFEQLNMTKPEYMLNIGSYSHGKQTGIMLEKIEEILMAEQPDAVLVYGDTNSTLAAAVAASKLRIPLIHIEAGLRSFNKDMPEEVNRIMTDHVSAFLFAPTETAITNLKNENITKNVYNVGDVMKDSLQLAVDVIGKDFTPKNQILLTIHRPYNTDDIQRLSTILTILNEQNHKIIFPIHPRTYNIIKASSLDISNLTNIEFIEPLSYFEMIKAMMESKCVITDSGGIQKEAYMLKRKCITLRSETEWIETLEHGWNTLIFEDLHQLAANLEKQPTTYNENMYGEGNISAKITKILEDIL